MSYNILCPNPVPVFHQISQYLEIFGFNLIDFMCFGDKGIVGIY